MTDKIFYHPETGRPLHRVPEGVTVPAYTPCGVLYATGGRSWWPDGYAYEVTSATDWTPSDPTFFTAEPIAPPVPPLPTEVGVTIRATSIGGDVCEVMTLGGFVGWVGVDQDGAVRHWEHEDLADWSPVMVVPNGVGVLDETDKRPVVDIDGDRWEWSESRGVWGLNTTAVGTKAAIDRDYGPLRFAGGSAS